MCKVIPATTDLPPARRTTRMRHRLVAGTHHNHCLRIYDAGMRSPVTGRLFNVQDSTDQDLKDVVAEAHWFVLLDGDKLTNEEITEISDYYNADNDQNLARNEIHLLLDCRRYIEQEIVKTKGSRRNFQR